jgi:hypothetical protein
MTILSVLYGDQVNLPVEFKSGDPLVATDPTTVTFKIMTPDGKTTTYVYGTDSELEKDSTGNYHVIWTANQEGLHTYRFEGSTPCEVAIEGEFIVPKTVFY